MDYQSLLSELSSASKGEVIAIDGPTGSGKTTLANQIKTDLSDVEIIHVDDLYKGWQDAFTERLSTSIIEKILIPISKKIEFDYEIYDWKKGNFYKSNQISNDKIFILDGVGSGQSKFRPYISKIIWLNISDDIGLSRVLHRDGDEILLPMLEFQRAQKLHFARESTENAADFYFEGVPKTLL